MPDKLTVDEILRRLTAGERGENVTATREIAASAGSYAPFPEWVHPKLRSALSGRGIERLYEHQALAAELAHQGRDVVIVTPTASGKTLCYNIPVLTAILEQPEARALYLFPTKALSQDQMHEVHALANEMGEPIKTFTYDGDTPDDARRAIRSQGHVVVSNPDMLHAGILPHHTKWQKLFANLRYVVLDELHTYRGVFGSHVANVLRRLQRVCRFYNSQPVFICCSATIANPAELAEALIERPVTLVERSGAPRSRKTLLLYNPPVINRELGIRLSAVTEARKLAARFIENDIQTIVFATSRLNVEVLTRYLKDRFNRDKIRDDDFVCGYRGGYLPNLRRRIEAGLREGKVMGVVSTSALELGIDIGDLSACVMAGYPGSIASTWQQAGRAGRRSGSSCAILIARSNPLDQFIVGHPDYFFGASPEHARINADNLLILLAHIKAAAFELPFEDNESFGRENLAELLSYLEEQGVLHHVDGRWHWNADAYPADEVSLRNISTENFVVVLQGAENKVIAEVDFTAAPTTIHTDAIYMVESQQYYVDQLDWERRRALVHPVDVDYYTDAMTYTNVRVLDRFDCAQPGREIVEHGEVQVARKVVGFKKIKFYTSENVGFGDVTLPDQQMHTTSYWFTVPQDLLRSLGFNRADLIDGLLGIAYALHHLAAVALMCDVRDLDRCVGDKSAEWFVRHDRDGRGIYSADEAAAMLDPERIDAFDPTLFIYDTYPGGIGLAPQIFRFHAELLQRAAELISACPCEAGCPSCVGPVNEVGAMSKQVALAILGLLLDRPK